MVSPTHSPCASLRDFILLTTRTTLWRATGTAGAGKLETQCRLYLLRRLAKLLLPFLRKQTKQSSWRWRFSYFSPKRPSISIKKLLSERSLPVPTHGSILEALTVSLAQKRKRDVVHVVENVPAAIAARFRVHDVLQPGNIKFIGYQRVGQFRRLSLVHLKRVVLPLSSLTVTDMRPSGQISTPVISAPLARTHLIARLISASVNHRLDKSR
jgi:hypothetical protein